MLAMDLRNVDICPYSSGLLHWQLDRDIFDLINISKHNCLCVRPSACLSVFLSVCLIFFTLFLSLIIMEFSGTITIDKSDAHGKV